MFRKMIAGFALALAAVTAMASQTLVETKGLSDAQIAEIKAIAAKKAAENAVNSTPTDKISAGVTLAATWGTQAAAAAEGFARAMGIAARELNVTVNEFLVSPAGMLTAGLIIWKMAGAALLHAMYGIVFLIIGLTVVRIIYTRLFTKGYEKVEYKRLWGLWTGTKMVRIPKSFADLENDGEWLAFWVMIILTVVILAVGGTFF